MTTRKLRLAINPGLIDKNVGGDDSRYVDGFENVELPIDALAAAVTGGSAYTAQLSGPRRVANFLASDVASVDVDHGMSVEQALAQPMVARHAGLIYTTASHTADAPRFRVVFPMARTITDAREMRAIQRSLALRLNGDPAAVDATRIFFGSRGAQTWLLGGELSIELMDELIAQSINSPMTNNVAGGVAGGVRSALKLNAAQPIRLANGLVLPFANVPLKAAVHCPFHADQNASAFTVASQRGSHGLHCSSCRSTYWPAEADVEVDFFDFDRVVRRAQGHFNRHRDFGPIGLFFNSSDSQIGLLGCNIMAGDGSPAPPRLLPGLTLIKSPKGSGKTESLKRLIAGSSRVLLIGHRRSLIRQSCRRLRLSCYLDPSGRFGTMGVCLDSLDFVPENVCYDVVILDECEQLVAHFLADTIERRQGGGREKLFKRFSEIVSQAKCVVALDADLGWITLTTLTRMLAPTLPDPCQGDLFEQNRRAIRLWSNERKPGPGKTVQIFRSKSHEIADLMQAAADGQRLFVTANSKALIDDITAMIASRLPKVRRLTITADTVTGKDQRAFLEDPQRETYKYDVILTSPAVGTGVDVTFTNNERVIDVVFGFCEANINTHHDFDQQLARVRHPGAVRAWVSPRRFHYETSVDAVRREILEASLFKNLLIDRKGPGGTARYVEDDALIETAALVISHQRASKNDLRKHFIEHKRWQGFAVEFVEPDDDDKAAGKELLALGKRLSDEKYADNILAAPPLKPKDFGQVSNAIKDGGTLSDSEVWSFKRTRIELFYRQPVTPDLIAWDARGRRRQRIMLFRDVERAFPRVPDLAHQPLERRSRFIREGSHTALAIARLLRLTPVLQGSAWNAEVVFSGDELVEFVRFATDNKAALENLLGIEIRADLAGKPMSQLKSILRLIGLDVVKAGSAKSAGRKVYRYRLDGDGLRRSKAVLEDRERIAALRFLAELHGWTAGEDDEDFELDDAA